MIFSHKDKPIGNLGARWGSPYAYDATVVTSNYNNDPALGIYNWTFSTVSSPFNVNGDHPVSGHRQFGLVQNPDTGEWVFYTRGLDRVSDNIIPLIDDSIPVFAGGNKLWECLTKNVADKLGGEVNQPIVHRPDWKKVKDEILSLTPTQVIDCQTKP